MKNEINSSLLIAFFGLLAGACSEPEPDALSAAQSTIPVTVTPIEKSNWNQRVDASGLFAAEDEQMMAFKIGGVIDKIYVNEGDAIRKGQLLAKLNLTEVAALTAQAKFGLEKAERDFNRASKLYADSVATLEQLQNSQTALELARKQYASADFNLAYAEIHALADGYVLMKMANDGEVIGGGMPVLRTSGDGSNWKLVVGVSDKVWAAISIGDSAVITADALSGVEMTSRVVRKSKAAERMTGSYAVELKVDPELQQSLASGMFGKAEIFLESKQETWLVPYGALLDANAGKGYVFVLNSDSTVQKVEVVIDAISAESVRVSKGLEGFDRLVVSGGPYLNEGSKVEIIKSFQP